MSLGTGVGIGIDQDWAPAAASFDPNFEYSPDPGFDNAGAWTILGTGASITGSAFVGNGSTSSGAGVQATAAGTITGGTYLVTVVISANANLASLTVQFGGSNIIVSTPGTGTFTRSSTYLDSEVTSQVVKIAGAFFSNKSVTITSVSIKRTA